MERCGNVLQKLQMKKEIITLGGGAGSGKDTACIILIQKYLNDYQAVSIGDITRKIGEEKIKELNLDLKDFNDFPAYARAHDIDYDVIADQKLKELGETGNKLIVNCRLGFHFIPYSFKVYLHCPHHTAAKRVSQDPKRTDNKDSIEELTKRFIGREQSDDQYYHDRYGLNYMNIGNYDLIVNTDIYNQEETAKYVHKHYCSWLQKS